jgi:protein-S-isoprenylcysteine O-methyltransferase Ste14
LSYGATLQRFRVPLGFVMAALYLAIAPRYATPLTVAVGGLIAFVGVLVRAWAAGHIVKNDRLATTGPYAHTRNPLYFGSFLIAAGFAIAAHWSLLLLVVGFFVAVYMPVIEREKGHIRGKFPDSYDEYASTVPAFVPRPLPWRGPANEPAPFSGKLYMRHGEWRAALGFVAALGYLILRMRLGA